MRLAIISLVLPLPYRYLSVMPEPKPWLYSLSTTVQPFSTATLILR
ncbi:hypothetical protein E2C01_068425 [Portunus trituberculatus]|uniref:Uncharacterized protein n=1 Tax=Portunus trituberculatus TaxID=210409 RepID=A0A5B7HNT4_PORTR|nr:hypothetical protein [Portunus trituberculatus]